MKRERQFNEVTTAFGASRLAEKTVLVRAFPLVFPQPFASGATNYF
jgi:hypothetical protein